MIKKKILDDLPWKMLSVLSAIVIWFLVVTVNDPIIRVSYEVPIQVINESYIASGKKTYQIEESYQSVLVTITGNSSTVNKLSAEDISVVADMTQIVTMDTNPVYVPITATCRNISAENISTASTTIPITIENVDSAKFPVSIDTENTKPDKDYEIGTMKALPENITVSGPESLVQKISSVVAYVDVTDMKRSGTLTATLQVIDKNQDVMSDSQMEFLSFDSGSATVDVQVELWKRKSDISLAVEYSGVPASGYQVSTITTTPETITVSGTDAALAALNESGNQLIIPAELICVSDSSEDMEVTVDLAEVLDDIPELRISSGSSSQVVVHVSVISNATKEYWLDVDEIQLKNLDKKLSVSFDTAQFEIRVSSTANQVTLDEEDIEVVLDCSSYTAGDYSAELQVNLPDGFILEEMPVITLHVKESVENLTDKETASQNNATKDTAVKDMTPLITIEP